MDSRVAISFFDFSFPSLRPFSTAGVNSFALALLELAGRALACSPPLQEVVFLLQLLNRVARLLQLGGIAVRG